MHATICLLGWWHAIFCTSIAPEFHEKVCDCLMPLFFICQSLYMPFLHCISSFVLLIKTCEMQPLDLLFLVVFISFYINRYISMFHKFLELHSTLSEKKIFVTNFLLLTDSLQPPSPWKAKICERWQDFWKVFYHCSQPRHTDNINDVDAFIIKMKITRRLAINYTVWYYSVDLQDPLKNIHNVITRKYQKPLGMVTFPLALILPKLKAHSKFCDNFWQLKAL